MRWRLEECFYNKLPVHASEWHYLFIKQSSHWWCRNCAPTRGQLRGWLPGNCIIISASGIIDKHTLIWWIPSDFYTDCESEFLQPCLTAALQTNLGTWTLFWREMRCLIKARKHAGIHLHWMKYQLHLATVWNASFICMGDQPYKV